ncbi:hypothetical protein BG005_004754 [Podila minutissima]|nr:hypothetical protein BG005_004754 [Podila minutissima]
MPNITEVIGLWYEAVMPSLFKNIFGLKTQRQRGSFRRMILEDYHWKEEQRLEKQRRKKREKRQKQRQKQREQRAQQQPQPAAVVQSGEASSTPVYSSEKSVEESDTDQQEGQPLSLLGKFGGCIRTIPDVHALWTYLEAPKRRSESSKTPPKPAKEDTGAFELLEHFLSRCTDLRLPEVVLYEDHFEDPGLLQLLVKYIVPATVHLVIETQDDPLLFGFDSDDSDHELARAMMFGGDDDDSDDEIERHPLSTWNFKNILASTSSKLEKLSLDIDSWDASEPDPDISVVGRSEVLAGLRELQIISPGKTPGSIRCWDWLWKHARGVQTLRVEKAIPQFTTSLIRGIAIYLRQIENIHIGRDSENLWKDKVDFQDPIIAKMLSAGHNYSSIYLDVTARAGPATVQVIPRHYSTLTEFTIEIGTGDDSFLVNLLAFSPNLRKLVAIKNGEYPFVDDNFFPEVLADRFADLDPSMKAYRPWACEGSLETLQIKIDGIPVLGEEELPMHWRVYGRLARLTKLQVLWLGHRVIVEDFAGSEIEDVQEECLQMTLESGLAVLSTLTKLRQLNLSDLYHNIGVADIQWMVESWPKLEKIWGLYDGHHNPARDWLLDHHPSLVEKSDDMSSGDSSFSEFE